MNYSHPILAKEGWPVIGVSLAVAIIISFFGGFWTSIPAWIIFVFVYLIVALFFVESSISLLVMTGLNQRRTPNGKNRIKIYCQYLR